jgi:hypothetical protein
VYYAILDDGRSVIVTNGKTRNVAGKEFFLTHAYVEVILDGGTQIVRKSRLKPAEYGSPFRALDSA